MRLQYKEYIIMDPHKYCQGLLSIVLVFCFTSHTSGQIYDPCSLPEPCNPGNVYPNPDDCTKYYMCNNGAKWNTANCPPKNTPYFDVVTSKCVAEADVQCQVPCGYQSTTAASSLAVIQACHPPLPCQQNHVLALPGTCNAYQICNNRQWETGFCPDGKAFDYKYNRCTSPAEAQCHPNCPEEMPPSVTIPSELELPSGDGNEVTTTTATTTSTQMTTTTQSIDPAVHESICDSLENGACQYGKALPDPDNCKRFYFCLSSGDTWNFKQECYNDDLFDVVTMKCVPPESALCMTPCSVPEVTTQQLIPQNDNTTPQTTVIEPQTTTIQNREPTTTSPPVEITTELETTTKPNIETTENLPTTTTESTTTTTESITTTQPVVITSEDSLVTTTIEPNIETTESTTSDSLIITEEFTTTLDTTTVGLASSTTTTPEDITTPGSNIETTVMDDYCHRPKTCIPGSQFPDPSDCTRYYYCNDGNNWNRANCNNADNSLFDINALECVKQIDATCMQSCLPQEEETTTVEYAQSTTGETTGSSSKSVSDKPTSISTTISFIKSTISDELSTNSGINAFTTTTASVSETASTMTTDSNQDNHISTAGPSSTGAMLESTNGATSPLTTDKNVATTAIIANPTTSMESIDLHTSTEPTTDVMSTGVELTSPAFASTHGPILTGSTESSERTASTDNAQIDITSTPTYAGYTSTLNTEMSTTHDNSAVTPGVMHVTSISASTANTPTMNSMHETDTTDNLAYNASTKPYIVEITSAMTESTPTVIESSTAKETFPPLTTEGRTSTVAVDEVTTESLFESTTQEPITTTTSQEEETTTEIPTTTESATTMEPTTEQDVIQTTDAETITTSARPPYVEPTCPVEVSNGILWTSTKVGRSERMPCPDSLTGQVVRACKHTEGGAASWDVPDYSLCVTKPYQSVYIKAESVLTDVDPIKPNATKYMINAAEVTEELKFLTMADTQSEGGMSAGNLNASVEILDMFTGFEESEDDSSGEKDILVQNLVVTADILLSRNNTMAWERIMEENQFSSSESSPSVKVMTCVDELGGVIASSLQPGHKIVGPLDLENIGIEAISVQQSKPVTVSFKAHPNSGQDGKKQGLETDSITLSEETVAGLANDVQGDVVLWSTYYQTLDLYLPTRDGMYLNSRVMSLSVKTPAMRVKLNPGVHMKFNLLNTSIDADALCSFWQYEADKEFDGDWSTNGCQVVASNSSFVECACDHLTNFAVLMSPYVTKEGKHHYILNIISIIGCLLSIFGCIVTTTLHILVWRRVKSPHVVVLIHLCIALVLGNALFLAGIERTEIEAVCIGIAAFLHYFYLVAFFIMLAEGVELFLYIIVVFNAKSNKEAYMLLLTAWILPAVIVGITLSVTRLEGYGNEEICWLTKEKGAIAAFIVPVIVIIIANFIILIKVLRAAGRRKNEDVSKSRIRATLKNLTVIMPLLGVTWIFGLLSINEHTVLFQYLFAICNSLQGFLIFIFHCVMNKKLREELNRRFSSGSSYTSSLKSSKSKTTTKKKSIPSSQSPNGTLKDDRPPSYRRYEKESVPAHIKRRIQNNEAGSNYSVSSRSDSVRTFQLSDAGGEFVTAPMEYITQDDDYANVDEIQVTYTPPPESSARSSPALSHGRAQNSPRPFKDSRIVHHNRMNASETPTNTKKRNAGRIRLKGSPSVVQRNLLKNATLARDEENDRLVNKKQKRYQSSQPLHMNKEFNDVDGDYMNAGTVEYYSTAYSNGAYSGNRTPDEEEPVYQEIESPLPINRYDEPKSTSCVRTFAYP